MSKGFSRQEYGVGCHALLQVIFPTQESKSWSLMSPVLAGGFFTTSTTCCCCQVALAVSDSVQPHRWQPTRLPCPWDSPGRNMGVGCHFLLQCMKVKRESEVTQSCLTSSGPMDCSLQAPPSTGFSRQENWSAVPLPSP